MKRLALAIAGLLAIGCGGETEKSGDVTPDLPRVEVTEAKTTPDLQPDLPGPEDTFELRLEETLPETVEPGCQPGDGCFLDPCTSNEGCQSGWCVEHMGEGVCTQLCQEECPPGWTCRQVGTGPDISYICVSGVANLCRPCATGADCKSPGGSEDVCVDYGPNGSFCGGACLSNEDCPWGFSCGEAISIDGVTSKQCLAETGSCPCTAKSIALGLSTPCEVENEFGICTGKRICTDSGLTECDAAAPSIEVCNGVDDDCDGDVDEPTLSEGKLQELCDDGNECTDDWCNSAEGCEHGNTGPKECKDGDPCTVADHCEAGVCVGQFVDCDDDNPCTEDFCNPAGGCAHENASAECDDGDPCTLGDHCVEGQCAGEAVSCDCQADADCAALEDGNLCNGTLICSKEKIPYLCVVKPGTEVTCPEPEGPDALCLKPACAPATGACSFVSAGEGKPCDDADACTVNDTCVAGECSGGAPANCNDGNPCTTDTCDPATGCAHGNSNEECSDNNPCTVGDHCEEGACVPESLVDCDDANPCTKDSCTFTGGCLHVDIDVPCDDGNACTINDQCSQGECVPGPALNCDDGNPCTVDSCNPATGCAHGNSNDACDDGNACTTGDHCEAGKCGYAGLTSCDDANVCTTDSCDPKQGCLHLLNTAPCDDKDVCTTGDHCHLGECISSGTLSCNDGNDCTDDSCSPLTGCLFVHNDLPCDDGDVCTTDDHCSGGSCQGGPPPDCADENPCTDDFCTPGAGCGHTFNTLPCSDGNACTLGEACANGVCTGGVAPDCDDDNLCTDDSCDPGQGCVNAPNLLPCSDGSVCTVNDQCADGSCQPGAPLDCDDGVPCTVDACNPAEGCVHGASNQACDDGNECTLDICHAVNGCSNPPVADNTPCGQAGWKCIGGVCKEKLPCDGGWAYKGRCWYEGPVMGTNNCPTCDTICANHGGCHEPSLVTEGWDQSCTLCKSTACPGCGCQDGEGNVAAHEAAPMHNGSVCEYTDHPNYPPICGMHYCNSSVYGRRRLCACNETP